MAERRLLRVILRIQPRAAPQPLLEKATHNFRTHAVGSRFISCR